MKNTHEVFKKVSNIKEIFSTFQSFPRVLTTLSPWVKLRSYFFALSEFEMCPIFSDGGFDKCYLLLCSKTSHRLQSFPAKFFRKQNIIPDYL